MTPATRREEDEPLFRYHRLGASVTGILKDDSATCLAVHLKFLALGTKSGTVHVLDLNGNQIRRFSPHSAMVNDVCIDRNGDFIGSCSQDGTVAISSLYDGAASTTHWYQRPVCAIALDPEYATRRVFASGGLASQLVLNAKGWFGAKESILHAGEGPVRAIAANSVMIAWANDLGIKVYDAQRNKRVSYVDRPTGSPPAEAFRPYLRWESETELLIGWADSIKIGKVRTRSAGGESTDNANGDGAASRGGGVDGAVKRPSPAGAKYMEIVTLIQACRHFLQNSTTQCACHPGPPLPASPDRLLRLRTGRCRAARGEWHQALRSPRARLCLRAARRGAPDCPPLAYHLPGPHSSSTRRSVTGQALLLQVSHNALSCVCSPATMRRFRVMRSHCQVSHLS